MTKNIFFDLNLPACYCDAFQQGASNEYGQNNLFPSHGIPADVRIPQMRRTLSWRTKNIKILMSRSVFEHSLRAVDVSREPSRYRVLFALNVRASVSHGLQGKDFPEHAGRCKRKTRLANLRRLCDDSDPQSTRALYQRTLRYRTRQHGLRARFHDHRFVLGALSLGAIPKEQRSYQASHAPGLAREHSVFHRYHRRESPRCQRLGHSDLRGLVFLYHGPRVHRFQKTLRTASGAGVLCDPRQIQSPVSQALFATGRQVSGVALRSNDCLDAIVRGLSGTTPSRKILRHGKRPAIDILDQQFCSRGLDYCPTLQMPLESRTVFQMDQTASADQGILRHLRERRQDPSLDCDLGLRADRNYQKTSGPGAVALHNSTNFECNHV